MTPLPSTGLQTTPDQIDLHQKYSTSRHIAWPDLPASCGPIPPLRCWEDPFIKQKFQPGYTVQVGILGCPGLYDLSRITRVPLYKISVTTDKSEGLEQRRRDLNRDAYGSDWLNGTMVRTDEGYRGWQLLLLPEVVTGSPLSPVQLGQRTLSITLPRGISYQTFDVALSSALNFTRLDRLAKSSFGKMLVAETGVHPSKLVRQTAYVMGRNEIRMSPCKEIICFRPRIEIPKLMGLIELTLLRLILPEVVVIKTLERAGRTNSPIRGCQPVSQSTITSE